MLAQILCARLSFLLLVLQLENLDRLTLYVQAKKILESLIVSDISTGGGSSAVALIPSIGIVTGLFLVNVIANLGNEFFE